jgi:hypothetical protein
MEILDKHQKEKAKECDKLKSRKDFLEESTSEIGRVQRKLVKKGRRL